MTPKNYKKDLGDNQLPGQGFGYPDDGWDGGSDKDDLWHQKRDENEWEIDSERIEREKWEAKMRAAEDEYYEEKHMEQAFEEEVQRLVKENKPLELFEFDDEKYFENYESISIKEVLKIKQLDVIDDVSLEGDFFSFQEMTDWLNERLFHFRFVAFDKSELEIG